MNKIREIIRLKSAGLSLRPIACSVRLSLGAVSKYVKAAAEAGLTWPLPEGLDDEALTRLVLGRSIDVETLPKYVLPDYVTIHEELKRKGVTLQLLWEEYRDAHGSFAYSYSQLCLLYRQWKNQLKRSMRQTHVAGEKLFVDYCGPTVPIYDVSTGEIKSAQIFVAVLGASNYTYAEATYTQQLPDWLGSHVRAFEFFGGVPQAVVPDNLKSGVDKACRYEPDINRSYLDLAHHYGVAIIPARPYKPKDKSKVEVGVQIVERWILAVLRHQKFFNLEELNAAIRQLLTQLNHKPFKKLPGSRRSAFEALDQPALMPLPTERYDYAEWKKVRVGIDYHVEFERHFYSVPHRLVGKEVELRITAHTMECFYQQQRVASHIRSFAEGKQTTLEMHMPKAHQAHRQWTPAKLLEWATTIGPHMHHIIEYQLFKSAHPELGYRACLGFLSLARKHEASRLEAACQRAINIGSPTRKSVHSILQAGLDRLKDDQQTDPTEPLMETHSNIRGATYYH